MTEELPAATPAKPRLRDRLWSFKSMVLVAAATLIVGGLTGAGITALAGHDRGVGPQFFQDQGRGPDGRQGPPGQRKPWQHEHFYWDDGPTPTEPPHARPPGQQRPSG